MLIGCYAGPWTQVYISDLPDKNAPVIKAVACIPIFGTAGADFRAIVQFANSVQKLQYF